MSVKMFNMTDDDIHVKKPKTVSIRKIWIYLLIILFVGIPVAVGILVWQVVSPASVLSASTGGDTDIKTTTQITTTTLDPNIGQVWDHYRLPRDVIPSHYNLTLYPDFYEDNAWFRGSEVIEVEVVRTTRLILIHSRNINITDVAITDIGNGLSVDIVKQFTYVKYGYLVLEFASAFDSGTHLNMAFTFEGSLADKIASFYKSTYTTSTGDRRHIVSTQMQPAFAREVFPCFDEPDLKATFTVTLIHRRDYTALSNMPVEVSGPSADHADMMATRFLTSVKMSSYLPCFIVCDFDHIENKTANGHLVRVWGPRESIPQLDYSMEIALHILDYLEEYLDVPNPIPKHDLIAIPNFDMGAMENWGIMTFRDTNLMFDPQEASKQNKQRVAAVVSHELVHNWFGNLVTLSWWGHLWLNEGFASYLQYFGVEDKHTEWKVMSQVIALDVQRAMTSDAKESSRPTVVHLERTSEFNSVFDTVSYSRGASILRMMRNFMGVDNFKRAMQIYLKDNAWGNAYTDDLWESFSKIERFPAMKTIMDTWTLQMGYPYVDVKFDVDNLGNTKISATQQRFKLQEEERRKSPFNYTWYIPLDYTTSEDSVNQTMLWMNRTGMDFEVSLNMTDTLTWIKFNQHQMGYYRVNYQDDIWRRFSSILQNNVMALGDMDRANLLDDAFSLAQAGIISYTTALDLTTYMNRERSYLPWYTFIAKTAYIRGQFLDRRDYQLLTKYVISKGKPAADALGWDSQSDNTNALLQSLIINLMCAMGESTCLAIAKDRFDQWIGAGIRVDPELRNGVYVYGMSQGGTEVNWNTVMDRYLSETSPQEKIRLLYALSQTSDLTLIHGFMNLALNESVVKSQDVFTLFAYTSYNPVGQDLVWLWLRANWQKLIDKFTLEDTSLGRVINAVTSGFNTETQLKEVEDFFRQYPDAGASASSREQTLESIRGNIQWQKTHYDTIVAWLRKNTPP